MKSTKAFKDVIKEHLDTVAAADPLFAETYKKPGKNIDDCVTYILNAVQKSGCAGFSDDEVFGMAMHYYDEEKIDIGKPVSAKVIINKAIELTPEEIEEANKKARQSAIDKVASEQAGKVKLSEEDIEKATEKARELSIEKAISEQKDKEIKKSIKKKTNSPADVQSLFD